MEWLDDPVGRTEADKVRLSETVVDRLAVLEVERLEDPVGGTEVVGEDSPETVLEREVVLEFV